MASYTSASHAGGPASKAHGTVSAGRAGGVVHGVGTPEDGLVRGVPRLLVQGRHGPGLGEPGLADDDAGVVEHHLGRAGPARRPPSGAEQAASSSPVASSTPRRPRPRRWVALGADTPSRLPAARRAAPRVAPNGGRGRPALRRAAPQPYGVHGLTGSPGHRNTASPPHRLTGCRTVVRPSRSPRRGGSSRRPPASARRAAARHRWRHRSRG